MTSKLRFESEVWKSTPLLKGVLLLVTFEWRFGHEGFGQCSEKLWHHCSLSSLYSTCNNKMLNCIHTLLATYRVVFIKTFHLELIPDSWNLRSFVGNHLNFTNYWFHAKFFVRVAANHHRHAICKRNGWRVPDCYSCLYLHVNLFRMHVDVQLQKENLILQYRWQRSTF